MDKYICKICATIYYPERGVPEDGIKPGTAFSDIPEDWVCTVCGSPKSFFKILTEEEYQKLVKKR